MRKNTRVQIKQIWKNFAETPINSLIPEIILHETETHRVILNSKGEIEIVSAMGEVQNLGKEIK